MPKPTNSTELLKALQEISQEIGKLHKSAENLLTVVNSAGVGESIATAFAKSAIRSGMPQSTAAAYRDEYVAMITRIRRNLSGVTELLEASGGWADGATHIMTVVPRRCNAPGGELPLTGR